MIQAFLRSSLGLSEERLDLAEALLDWIEIRRIGRQIAELRASPSYQLFDALDLMDAQVIHDDDVAGPQGWHEYLLDVGEEGLSGECPIDLHRGGHPIEPHRRHDRDIVAVVDGCVADSSLPFRCASVAAGHGTIAAELIQENKSARAVSLD